MMREIFLGRPLYWGLWVIIIAVLKLAGNAYMHVRWFPAFIMLVLALSAFCIVFVVVTYRKGEAITREPFEEAASGASPRATADE